MKIFDKGKPLSREYCDFCKKEIEPGEKLIMLTICPSHAWQLWNRGSTLIYSFIDNAEKYHEECYMKKMKKK